MCSGDKDGVVLAGTKLNPTRQFFKETFIYHLKPKKNTILMTVQNQHKNIREYKLKHFSDLHSLSLFSKDVCCASSYLLLTVKWLNRKYVITFEEFSPVLETLYDLDNFFYIVSITYYIFTGIYILLVNAHFLEG